MTPIPKELRARLEQDPEYKLCARYGWHDHKCDGRITFEHVLIFRGTQLQERWAIIPLCAKAHAVDYHQDGKDLKKEINLWIALNRASDSELAAVSKAIPYLHRRQYLNQKYGVWEQKLPSVGEMIESLTSKPRPIWIAVEDEERSMLEYCKKHTLESEGRNLSSNQMFREILRHYYSEIREVRSILESDKI